MRVIFASAFILCTLGVFYPVVGMSAEEETRGKIVLGVLASVFLGLIWVVSKFLANRNKLSAAEAPSIFKPYKVEHTNELVVYEFKTVFVYLLHSILAIVAIGYLEKITELSIIGILLLVFYFLFVSTQYLKVGRITKHATRHGSVEVSGSKWSFSNPLRIKIDNEHV